LYGDLGVVIAAACSKINVLTGAGRERCDDICGDTDCCFDDGPNSCSYQKKYFCSQHESCRHLVMNSKSFVDDICSKENVSSVLGAQVCSFLCVERLCCFKKDDKYCYDDVTSWCNEFDSCHNIDIDQVVKDFDNDKYYEGGVVGYVCSVGSLYSGGATARKDCEEICSSRACCFFSGRDNCSEDYPEWCEEFNACNNLLQEPINSKQIQVDGSNSKLDSNNDQATFGDNSDEANVYSLCAKDNINSGDNYRKCEALCMKRKCCFRWGSGSENCLSDNYDWCNEFRACFNLDWANIDNNNGETSIVLANTCSKINILTEAGRNRCDEICASSECCFAGAGRNNCYDQKQNFCKQYEPCRQLYSKPESYVEEFCSKNNVADELGDAICSFLCTERLCCFKKDENYCFDKYQSWCNDFKSCENVNMFLVVKNYDTHYAGGIVSKVCNPDVLLTENKYCNEICSQRACCFFPGRDNCYREYPDWCDEFKACNNMYD